MSESDDSRYLARTSPPLHLLARAGADRSDDPLERQHHLAFERGNRASLPA